MLDQLGLTVNYTATIKLKAYSRDTHKHVLLVGLGGTLVEAFKMAVKTISDDDKNYHFINEMIKGGKQDYLIYAGGNSDRPETKQDTSNAPGWATILTGVWANKHGIKSTPSRKTHEDSYEKKYHKDIPTVFNDIKDDIPKAYTVSLAEWKDINTLAKFKFSDKNDAASLVEFHEYNVTPEAIKELNHIPTPTFMFLQYDDVAHAGHITGYDPKVGSFYTYVLKATLMKVNKVLEKVQKLRDSGQQWLVIFTTDHGGKGNEGKDRSWEERQVFATYHDPKDKRYSGGGEIKAYQGQTNITPTILDYFGITIPKNLYGKPINAGELPVRSLWAKFDWFSDNLVDDYPQLTRNVLPTLGDNIKKINKALMSGDSATSSEAYFFLNDGTYITYNVKNPAIISDRKPIKSDWKCLTEPKIASAKIKGAVAFKDNSNKNKEEYFFIFDNNYCTLCKLNPPHDTVNLPNSNYPEKLEEFSPRWAGLMDYFHVSNTSISMVRRGKSNTVYAFIDGGWVYLKFNPFSSHMKKTDVRIDFFTNRRWNGIGRYNIQVALSPSSNNIYSKEDKLTGGSYAFFLKPMKYN